MVMGVRCPDEISIRLRRLFLFLLGLAVCKAVVPSIALAVNRRACFVCTHLQLRGSSPRTPLPPFKARRSHFSVHTRCNAKAARRGGALDPPHDGASGGKELSLRDLGSSKWLAHQLHEYVQAKEAEKRKVRSLSPPACSATCQLSTARQHFCLSRSSPCVYLSLSPCMATVFYLMLSALLSLIVSSLSASVAPTGPGSSSSVFVSPPSFFLFRSALTVPGSVVLLASLTG